LQVHPCNPEKALRVVALASRMAETAAAIRITSSGSIRISKEIVFDRMRGFYTENGLENQRKSSPLASRCVAAPLWNVATQGGSEATDSVKPALGSLICGVMTSQIKGLGVETIGPITTEYKGWDFSTSSHCQSQRHVLVIVLF
jgi:hypothetical protein